MSIQEAKAAILKERHQRIRLATYDYVAALMLEDTAFNHPFRDRLVIDWWARVIDPLEAESFDKEPKGRLAYFRRRLKEHRHAPAANAALRQGLAVGRPQRRLNGSKLAYVRLQVKRLGDRRLNYAAAAKAIQRDVVYLQLVVGLLALDRFRPGHGGLLDRAAQAASRDVRFAPLVEKVRGQPDVYLPGYGSKKIEARIEQISDPRHRVWELEQTFLTEMKRRGLIRKLEEKYINKIK